jgi:predicted NAD/FAD-dependent oxidoreductase
VVGLEAAGRAVVLRLEDGARLEAPVAILALAPEQALELLATFPAPPPSVRSASAVLDMTRSHPCLAVMATYPAGTPRPSWHVNYPESSNVVQVVSNETSKRGAPGALALVIQAHAAWSSRNGDDPGWPDALLREAAALHGEWAAHPAAMEPHRWRYARGDLAGELAAPLLLALDGGGRLGLAGERFAPGGGVEAAWLSGRQLAARILEETRA